MNKAIAIDPNFADSLVERQPQPRRPRNTREAIIDSAEKLFINKGYHGTRVSEVAGHANVSIGSIYVHFESKEGLYAALMERALTIEARYFDATFDNPDVPDLEKIFSLGEAYLQFFREYPAYFRMLMLPPEDVPEETHNTAIGRQVAARGLRQQQRLTEVIKNSIEQGSMRSDINPVHAANFWWAAWNGAIALTLRRDELALDEEEMGQVVIEGRRMIAQGMAASMFREKDGGLKPEILERINTLRHEVVPPPAR